MSVIGNYLHLPGGALKSGWRTFKNESTLRGIVETFVALDEGIGHANRALVRKIRGKI